MSGDRAEQNAALIGAAQRVRLAEIEVGDIEERLTTLRTQEAEIRFRLDTADLEIGTVLAALQRIGRNPPPALVVDPADALSSARGAILISEILPQLTDRATAIAADLLALETVKAALVDEEEQLLANLTVLQEDQLRIATLIEARRRGVERATSEIATSEAEAEALAAEAESLNELIGQLEARLVAASLGAEAVAAVEAGGDAPALDAETIRLALANPERTEPAVPFASAKGFLTFPAAGVTVQGFGTGGREAGVSVVTRAEAQVVAPADSVVLYRGPYLNYGQIIILSAGQGYSILLAGLDAVTLDQGQFVLMGEPVGQMGSRTLGQAVTTNAGTSSPTLYIEFRKDNQPIDPSDWWDTDTTQSG
jgi:septal ring factor EnvC (AmiA/AmiB activator)